MRTYNFNDKLDWNQFQKLACEIIQHREKLPFQTFRAGKDKGMDGLWFCGEENIILQAKRYQNFSDLYKELKTAELTKVKKLNPRRYILVVSMELSETEYAKIRDLFSEYIKQNKDLLDANSLNSLLSEPEYRWIERNFTSLWIPDGAILEEFLQEILHKGIRNRNTREQRKAIEACQTFVQTGIYNEARAMLDNNHTVVISGQPGMGKSTIARILALDFLTPEGYEGLYWVNSLEEIENEWEEGRQKQVFILDDYWGSAFHRQRDRRENYRLEELIFQLKRESNKRLIITSREYIVQQELFLNPELEDIIQKLKMECVLREYTDAEKARILFAHLRVSDLEMEYIRSIYGYCNRLVCNLSYSPRVIEKFIKEVPCENYTPREYAQELLGWMEYPEKMWEGVFRELSEEAKIISAIVAISYTPISVTDIRNTYSSYVQCFGGSSAPKSFENCITELEETILFAYMDEEYEEIRVEFENPSILDFLLYYISKNQEFYIPRLAKSSIFYNQLLMLLEHFQGSDEKLNQMVEQRCMEEFYELPMKLEDYGERELGEAFLDHGSDWAGRAFHLMRVAESEPGEPVWEFIREFVKDFFLHMEEKTLFDGAGEMMNFVGLIGVCEKKGLHFNGREILENYWTHCSSYKDYEGFSNFKKVYPGVYEKWEENYFHFMKENVRELILKTLEDYEDKGFFGEEDLLVDSVPDILKEYGLYYTKKFKQEIAGIAGRYFEEPKYGKKDKLEYREETTKEEADYRQAKEEGYRQLIGEPQVYTDEEAIEDIKNCRFTNEDEAWLLQVIESGMPWYLYEFMTDENSICLLKQMEEEAVLKIASSRLDFFHFVACAVMTGERKELTANVIDFCVDYAIEMLFREIPVLSEAKFRQSASYKEYVEKNPELERVLFTYLLGRQGKWITIKQENFVLFCLCWGLKGDTDFDWDSILDLGWGTCLVKKRKEDKAMYFPDFVNPRNTEWIRKIQIIMNEIDEDGFRQEYVIPKIEAFLKKYEGKAERAEAFMEDIRWEIDIDLDGEICGSSAMMEEAMILAENLEIATLYDAEERLSDTVLKSLMKRKKICTESKYGHITVSVYQEKDKDYLRKQGVFQALEHYLEKLERFVLENKRQ